MQARLQGVKRTSAVDDRVFVFQEFLFQRVFVHFVDGLVFRGSAGLALQSAKQMFQCVIQLGGRAVNRLFQGIALGGHRQRLMAFWPRFQAAT